MPERSDELGGLYEETGLWEGPSVQWPAYLAAHQADVTTEVVGADQIAELWKTFGAAISLDRLRLSYGSYWPRQPVAGERAWVFRAAPALVPCGELAAWGALRPDPVDPIAWLMLGVWPAHQGKGWADYVRQWLVQTAATQLRVEYVGVEILRNNIEHLDRWLHRTPPGWRRIGEIEIPAPGGVFFTCPATPNRTEYGRSERP